MAELVAPGKLRAVPEGAATYRGIQTLAVFRATCAVPTADSTSRQAEFVSGQRARSAELGHQLA
jgi:hypothetical protein